MLEGLTEEEINQTYVEVLKPKDIFISVCMDQISMDIPCYGNVVAGLKSNAIF